MTQKPAISLAAVAGRRNAAFELAQRVEREGIEAWYATGVKTLIVVPYSARGNQLAAF